jgi:predicted outer membrane repeat protein
MKWSRLFAVLGVIWLAFLPAWPIGFVQPAFAADAVVSGACDDAAFSAALAIVEASPGGTITFDCGAAPFFVIFAAQKTITKNVVIDGADLATLSGNTTTRLFYVAPGGTLTLKKLTVSNGYSGLADAGAIFSSGALVIDDCHFKNNHTGSTAYSGGAILNTGPLTIIDSEFSNNTAGSGGALFPRWGNAVTTITNSSFHDNQAKNNTTSGWGGAILAWDGVPLIITGSTFSNNWAASDGGAINLTANSTLAMTGGSMSGNQSNNFGGAMSIYGSAALTDTVISGNTAVSYGGGLYNSGTTNLNRVWLSANRTFDRGGGIYNQSGTLTIHNSSLTGNNTYEFGGGIYAKGTVNLVNTTLAHNRAEYSFAYGGGIAVDGSVVMNFVTLLDNSAKGYPTQGGHSIYRSSGLLSIKNTIIQSDTTACDGGGAVASSGFNLATDGTCGLTHPSDKTYLDPQLKPLGYYGGPTLNALPKAGSPALDNGQCGGAPKDQRGVSRPQAAACDIGAAERKIAEPESWIFLPVIIR